MFRLPAGLSFFFCLDTKETKDQGLFLISRIFTTLLPFALRDSRSRARFSRVAVSYIIRVVPFWAASAGKSSKIKKGREKLLRDAGKFHFSTGANQRNEHPARIFGAACKPKIK